MASSTPIIPLPFEADLGAPLWLVHLDGAPGLWDTNLLSAEEAARAARYRFDVHAARYRASHIALRQILGEATGHPPEALRFKAGSEGKPRLDQPSAPHFNLSHSAGWALIGVCDHHPIGVDIEVVKPMSDVAALVQRHFTVDEQAAFLNTPAERQLSAFFSGWTRKEACLKAVGSGLTIEPCTFEAGLEPQLRATTILVNGEPCGLRVRSIAGLPQAGLVAAVAQLTEPCGPALF